MTGLELFLTIIGIVAVIPTIRLIFIKTYLFMKKSIFNKDIYCSVLNHSIRGDKGTTKIKIAYAGTGDDILKGIRFTYLLKLPAPIDRFLAYYNIGIGYITCDMQGLTTMLGTQHYIFEPPMIHLSKMPRFVKYPLSVLIGVWWLYYLLLMSLIPLGWIFLNWGPYGRFSLDSINESIRIVGVDSKIAQLPIVLKPGTEIILDISYRMGLNAKGFSTDTPYKFLKGFPKRTLRPPKPGNFTWVGRGNISILLGNKWNKLLTELDKRVIIGIGSQ